ncbi:MAG: S8 family serine peptidase [Bacteroidia bacterium]
MNKALPILSITLFLFLVSCEPEFPISLEPTQDDVTLEGNNAAFMVSQKHGDLIQGEYIVMFKEDLDYFKRLDLETTINRTANTRSTRAETSTIREKREGAILSYLENTLAEHHLPVQSVMSVYDLGRNKGGLVSMTDEDALELAQDDRVAIIEPNEIIAMNLNAGAKGRLIPADDGPSTQWTTYNVSAVGGNKDHTNEYTWAFIIDSGIDLDHTDLNVQPKFSKSFVPYEADADDGFGHGTHVAGIIGAKNNGAGVIGVASGATLVAYKVLDRYGSGTKDYLIQALSEVSRVCIPGDVVNISLGTDKSSMINTLITNLKNSKGIYFTIAAGNEGADATNYSPSDLDEANIFVVGSINWWNYISGFSNYGSSVQYLAPGEGIYSTFKDGKYAWMKGTSMAAPHVAGILLANNGNYNVRKQIRLASGNYAKVVKH